MNSLLQLRRRLGLSQAELGSAIGVTQSAISQCEQGLCQMAPATALRLISYARTRDLIITMESFYADRHVEAA